MLVLHKPNDTKSTYTPAPTGQDVMTEMSTAIPNMYTWPSAHVYCDILKATSSRINPTPRPFYITFQWNQYMMCCCSHRAHTIGSKMGCDSMWRPSGVLLSDRSQGSVIMPFVSHVVRTRCRDGRSLNGRVYFHYPKTPNEPKGIVPIQLACINILSPVYTIFKYCFSLPPWYIEVSTHTLTWIS